MKKDEQEMMTLITAAPLPCKVEGCAEGYRNKTVQTDTDEKGEDRNEYTWRHVPERAIQDERVREQQEL